MLSTSLSRWRHRDTTSLTNRGECLPVISIEEKCLSDNKNEAKESCGSVVRLQHLENSRTGTDSEATRPRTLISVERPSLSRHSSPFLSLSLLVSGGGREAEVSSKH